MKNFLFGSDHEALPMLAAGPSSTRRPAHFHVAEDAVANGVFVGLIALTLVSVGYALANLCGAVSGGIVTEAVRALLA